MEDNTSQDTVPGQNTQSTLNSDLSPSSDLEVDLDFSPIPELVKQCCICTRKDRKLLHLCLVNGGGNSLFSLLCNDNDNSPEGSKEPTRLIICWECDAIMSRIGRFRQQACKAQKRLLSISEGRTMAQNTFVLIPPVSGARGSGPEAILEYRTQSRADPSQPLLRVVRYDGSATELPPPREGASQSSLQELLEGIHQ